MTGDTYYKEVWVTVYSVQPRTKLVYTVYMRLDLILVLALLLLRVNGRSVTSQRSDQSEALKNARQTPSTNQNITQKSQPIGIQLELCPIRKQ